ncbi:MAG: HEAT repeat domain-containing protein, partial [Acidobacteria bacterium]|nr:HEAT repeat domain-containing protein [Acidobacteriota bacterium]
QTGALAAAIDGIRGPRTVSANSSPLLLKLSDSELQYLDKLPPQQQAERLMQAALNHDGRALQMVDQRLPQWNGQLQPTATWADLELAARSCNDLRVRAAAIDINLNVYKIKKDTATANRLHDLGLQHPTARAGNAYALGMLANRGVEPDAIRTWLLQWAYDKDAQTRLWAVEGLGMIGTDQTIADLTEIFRSDPSLDVRERAGANLAKAGMLTREQRLQAVPGLVRAAEDPKVDDATRAMMYEALQLITDQSLLSRPATWRDWYASASTAKLQEIRASDPWVVPGR